MLTAVIIAILLGLVSVIVAGLYEVSILSVLSSVICLLFAIILALMYFPVYYPKARKHVRAKNDIMMKIISGELNTPDRIRECWEKLNK